jgi:hypothetical protein
METAIQMSALMKRQKAMPLEKLAKDLGVSQDFVLGIIDSSIIYKREKDLISLIGLGTERCIVCGENIGEYDNIFKAKIPDELINGRKLDSSLYYGEIKGHRKCYSEIDVFFRYEDKNSSLVCWDCNHWSGAWVDGDEVEEKCYVLNEHDVGHRGVIGRNKICNLFSPDSDMKPKDRKYWEKIKPEVQRRTQQGYKNLVAVLEKAYLIK